MSYSASKGALTCPFCGSTQLVQQQDGKSLAPRWVVTFTIELPQAEAILRQWLGRGYFRPSDLAQRAALIKMTPVYVPYWLFHATTHTYWTADSSQTPSGASGDWYPLSGEHHGKYENVPVAASAVLTSSETAQLQPYRMQGAKPPDEVDLDSFTVERFRVNRKFARPLARLAIEDAETRLCSVRYVPGRARNVHVNVRIEAMRSQPVLLPVWIMAYRYRQQVYRFLINGQTGKSVGRAPLSWFKIMGVAALMAGLVVSLVLLIASFS
jgi:hypothetical protein